MAKTTLETSGNKDVLTRTAAEDEAMPDSVLEDGSLDPVYEAKAKMLNKAIQDIGMGRYQWQVSDFSLRYCIAPHFTFSCSHLHPRIPACGTSQIHSGYKQTKTFSSSSLLLASAGRWTISGLSSHR